eukprot:gene15114-26381_t
MWRFNIASARDREGGRDHRDSRDSREREGRHGDRRAERGSPPSKNDSMRRSGGSRHAASESPTQPDRRRRPSGVDAAPAPGSV